MKTNKLIVAAAGSGKTTLLVNEALKLRDQRCLITTFTTANEGEIRNRIIRHNKCIPENIIVQTWFSFLLQHGVRPYQGQLFDKKIEGMILVSGRSAKFHGESQSFEKHYFTDDRLIYSDKISKFVVKANLQAKGAVIERLGKIFPYIFIDEVQDLAGYDLELLKLLFASKSHILLVGDPRQGTYSTNNSAKQKQFRKSEIVHFFENHTFDIEKDDASLNTNWRCNACICKLSNKLYPDFKDVKSGHDVKTTHDGVFLVRKNDVPAYLKTYYPVQLRYNSKTVVDGNYKVMNFGESKGLEFERVLIYPPKPVLKWLQNNKTDLAATSRSKFYVAITRARFSTAIVFEYTDNTHIEDVQNYNSNNICTLKHV